MMRKLRFALLFVVLTCEQIASDQISPKGNCPKMQLPDKFDWYKFTGVWYEFARYPDYLEGPDVCVRRTLRQLKNENIGVVISGIDQNNKEVDIDATGEILPEAGLLLTFKDDYPKRIERILGTDFRTWATVFSCRQNMGDHDERAWILTRDRYPNSTIVSNAIKALSQNKISAEFLIETRQKGCSN